MPKSIGILGKKVGMTRIYSEDGTVMSVTVVEAGPCVVLQKKTTDKEGYNAIQVGFLNKKDNRSNKPASGHCAPAGKGTFYHIKEFRVDDPADYEVGQEIRISDVFKIGDIVDVQGRVKGRGFQGVVRRYGFGGGRKTHGSNFHRAPGSIGCSAYPGKVMKGKKMPGRMGNNLVTKKNVIVVDIRDEENVMVVRGSMPGAKAGLLQIFTR